MRNYDLTFILSSRLSEEQVNDLIQQFTSFIQEEGGILDDQKILGKKPLLAPIQNEKEGYLTSISFSLNEAKLAAIEKKSKETPEILRTMLLKQPKRIMKRQRQPSIKQPIQEIAQVSSKPETADVSSSEHKKEEKVDLKDIDEKLEEIFKDI